MKKLMMTLSLLLAPLATNAADLATLQSVLSSATVDLNNDGGFDRAVLASGVDGYDASLYIFLSKFDEDRKDYTSQLAFQREGFVFNGGMWGQQPTLATNSKGSLLLKSKNDAIGRDRWSQTLTIGYRGNEFKVIGITYTHRDTLDPNSGGSCDLNLLTGKGVRNGKPVNTTLKPISLANWDDQTTFDACRL